MASSVTFNGKPFNAKDFEAALKDSVNQIASAEMRERIACVRDPLTGEFPTVCLRGKVIEDMSVLVEASPALLKIIRDRVGIESTDPVVFVERKKMNPTAFLSYASEDKQLAEGVAIKLQEAGINTWWADWEIGAGDSIVQKINDGLAGCTHFIVLLTPNAIGKPWVKSEMDAGFIQSVSGQSKFIVLRSDLPVSDMPSLLRPLLSPEIQAGAETDIQQLISDIYGLTRKPELGKPPLSIDQPPSQYSPAAMSIAEFFFDKSENGIWSDVMTTEEELSETTGLSIEDVEDALYELRNFVRDDPLRITVEDNFYSEFDGYFTQERDPAEDAFRIAIDLNNDPEFPHGLENVAEKYGWNPRRLNPAVSYLIDRELIDHQHYMGSGDWVTSTIEKTGATRRLVKSRSLRKD